MKPFDLAMLRLVPGTRGPVAALGVLGILQGIATIALVFVLADLIVEVVGRGDLARPALLLVLLFATRALLAYLAETVQAWAGMRVAAALRERLIDHWLSAPADSRPDPAHASTLAAQGCTAVEPYAARFLPSLIHAAVVPLLAIVAIAFVDWSSAVIVVLTVPLLPLFAALIGAKTADETDKRWKAMSGLAGHFLDVMRGLPTLVSYGRGERQVDTIAEVSQRHRRATMRTLRLAFMSSAALELLASISVAIVAVWCGIRLAEGHMELAPALLAILLAPEAYWPIRRVGQEFHAAADGAQAIAEATTVLSAAEPDETVMPDKTVVPDKPVVPDQRVDAPRAGSRGTAARVVAEKVSYTYPGSDQPVIDGVSLTAGPGLTVLTGVSGAGKSTLLELIAGLRTPQSGTITTSTITTSTITTGTITPSTDAPSTGATRTLTSAAHLVSQRPFVAAGSVRDNLRLGNGASDDALWDALRRVGLEGVVAAMPGSLDTELGDDGFGLSAGQRSRLVLARALLSDRPVLLLDEPTAHLDAETSHAIHDVIRELAAERTVIAVTHRPELLQIADEHIHLDRARVTA